MVSMAWRYRPEARYLPRTALYFLKLLAWEPMRLAERAYFRARGETATLPHPPVFILGYYRSGTTHLQEVLLQDPRFGYMDFYQCFFPTAFTSTEAWVKPVFEKIVRAVGMEHPAHGIPFSFALPGEDDVSMVASGSRMAANWAQVYPDAFREIYTRTGLMEGLTDAERARFGAELHDLLWRVSRSNGHRRLLLKSPPHTGRMGFLADLYPNAKFIFIRRNPYEVYKSNLKLWKSFEKTSLQTLTPAAVRDHILWSHDRCHHAYERDKATLAPGRLVELTFEGFMADPEATMRRIYETLDLGDFATCGAPLVTYLDAHHAEERSPYSYTDDELDAIEASLGHWIDAWGYAAPRRASRDTVRRLA